MGSWGGDGGGGPGLGRGFLPLLAGCPQMLAALGPSLGGQARPKVVPGAAPRPLGQTRQRRRFHGPRASHAEGLPSEAGGLEECREWVSFPSTQGMAGRVELLFLQSQAWRQEQLRWLGRGPGKKMKNKKIKRKKEMKNQWLKYSVSQGVGWGVPGPSPGGILSIWRGQHKEAGIWQMASVWGAGEGWQ